MKSRKKQICKLTEWASWHTQFWISTCADQPWRERNSLFENNEAHTNTSYLDKMKSSTCNTLLWWSCQHKTGNPTRWTEAVVSSAGMPEQHLSKISVVFMDYHSQWRGLQRNAKSSCDFLHLQNCAGVQGRMPHPLCLVAPASWSFFVFRSLKRIIF